MPLVLQPSGKGGKIHVRYNPQMRHGVLATARGGGGDGGGGGGSGSSGGGEKNLMFFSPPEKP